jgi:hypothetical protein
MTGGLDRVLIETIVVATILKDDFGSILPPMTMRDWIERVGQLRNPVEHWDRDIADQKRTIAYRLAII